MIEINFKLDFFLGDNDIARLLLEHGANIDSLDKSEMTPLLVAISSENVKTAKYLIEKGADINARSDSNFTALINAARFGKLNVNS